MTNVMRNIRIGLFVVLGLTVVVVAIAILGRDQALFSRSATLYAYFGNASGLVPGSPVRLAGIDVGTVNSISLPEDPEARKVIVEMTVHHRYLDRIREDSVATLTTKGLLGDMVVNISMGSPSASPLEDGDRIRARDTRGLSELIGTLESAASNVEGLTNVVNERLRDTLTEDWGQDFSALVRGSAKVVEEIQTGDGLMHALIYDEALTRETQAAVRSGRAFLTELEVGSARVNRLLAQIEEGDGPLHGLLYADGGAEAIESLSRAASGLDALLREVREGDGLLHSLVYEKRDENILENLGRASTRIEQMVEEIDQGKGTIGGLIKDPTVYRDLKEILGNLKRNAILKALIRFTIDRDELERAGQIEDEE